jgi:hypothetical protein
MPELPSIDYGTESLTLTETTARVLRSMLGRLPEDLWNRDPDALTLQRDIYQAIAAQVARWLENRTIATPMTLLLEAQGLDLDRLLRDYGLRRYMQRPDDYARQIGLHCLYIPKATDYAVRRLADLLLAVPHTTLVTGPGEIHTLVAATRPITASYTYWRLVSEQGVPYAVTVHYEVPTCTRLPPPGLDQTPGGIPLDWLTLRDETHALWYVAIRGDSFVTSSTPLPGHGTFEPFEVLDGAHGRWSLRVDHATGVLVSAPLSTSMGYWRLTSASSTVYAVFIDGGVPTINTTFPPGRDETPATTPLDWFVALDGTGVPWYVTIAHDTLITQPLLPAGTGTTTPFRTLDAAGALWSLTAQTLTGVLVATLLTPAATTAPVLDPAHGYEAVQLHDENAAPWWLWVQDGAGVLTSTLPAGATDVTPPGGPYRWLRLEDLQGQRWYGFPDTLGVFVTSLTNPGGRGTLQPTLLGDARGVQWHYGIDPAGVFTTSSRPPMDYGGLSSALILHDAQGVAWCWRVTNTSGVPFFEVSAALWEDAVPGSPWGSLSWLLVPNDAEQARYVFPSVVTGLPQVEAGPPPGALWGWSEPVLLVDQQGTQYALGIDATNVLEFHALPPDDIPLPQPTLPLRDFYDAMLHVRAQGSLVTLRVA